MLQDRRWRVKKCLEIAVATRELNWSWQLLESKNTETAEQQKMLSAMTIVEELDSYQREKMFDGVGFHTTR